VRISLICAGVVCLLGGSLHVSQAGTIRNDVGDSFYTSLAQQSVYDSVGFLTWSIGSSGYIASGTLIAPDWVLTAGHVVGGPDDYGAGVSGMAFGMGPTYNGIGIFATEWIPYGGWSSSGVRFVGGGGFGVGALESGDYQCDACADEF